MSLPEIVKTIPNTGCPFPPEVGTLYKVVRDCSAHSQDGELFELNRGDIILVTEVQSAKDGWLNKKEIWLVSFLLQENLIERAQVAKHGWQGVLEKVESKDDE